MEKFDNNDFDYIMLMGYGDYTNHSQEIADLAFRATDEELERMSDIQLAYLLVYCRNLLLLIDKPGDQRACWYEKFRGCTSNIDKDLVTRVRDRCENVIKRRYGGVGV